MSKFFIKIFYFKGFFLLQHFFFHYLWFDREGKLKNLFEYSQPFNYLQQEIV